MKDETVQQESRIKILFSQSNSCVYLCVVFPGPGPSNQHSQRRNKLVTNIRQHITKSNKKKNRYRGQFDIHDQYLIVPFVKKMYRSLIVIYFVQKQSFHRNISNFVNELGTEGFRTGFFGSPCSFTSEEMAVLGIKITPLSDLFQSTLLVTHSSLLQWCKLQADFEVLFDISNFEHSTTTKITTVHLCTLTHTIHRCHSSCI